MMRKIHARFFVDKKVYTTKKERSIRAYPQHPHQHAKIPLPKAIRYGLIVMFGLEKKIHNLAFQSKEATQFGSDKTC